MDYSNLDYQVLSIADKRKIIQDLDSFLSKIHKKYGERYVSKNDIKELIRENKYLIITFAKLMKYEGDIGRNPSPIDSDTNKSFNDQDIVKNDRKIVNENEDDGLSEEIRDYINKFIEDKVMQYMQGKLSLILNQYEELKKEYNELSILVNESKTQTKSSVIEHEKYVEHPQINQIAIKQIDKSFDKEGRDEEKVSSPINNEKVNDFQRCDKLISIEAQRNLQKATEIYNQNYKSGTLLIRRKLRKDLDKPVIRLTLSENQGFDFANKLIADLKQEKNRQDVCLVPTEGSNEYIAQAVDGDVYAVFPEVFTSYTESFSWRRAYPLFFNILPSDNVKASKCFVEQPALFKKINGKYQILENGKGRISLE